MPFSVIAAAALGTLALFGGFSLAALRADRAAYIKYGGIMFGALIFLVSIAQFARSEQS